MPDVITVFSNKAGYGLLLLHRKQTACLWWGVHVLWSWLWGGRDWKACHVISYGGKSLSWCTECVLQRQSEEDPEENGSKDAALFDPAADVERSRGAAVELHSPLHVAVGGGGGVRLANLWKDIEGDVQGHLLFSLKLAEGDDHVYCWSFSSDTALRLWVDAFG